MLSNLKRIKYIYILFYLNINLSEVYNEVDLLVILFVMEIFLKLWLGRRLMICDNLIEYV